MWFTALIIDNVINLLLNDHLDPVTKVVHLPIGYQNCSIKLCSFFFNFEDSITDSITQSLHARFKVENSLRLPTLPG